MSDILTPFTYLHGKPQASGIMKAVPEHFIVKEVLGFEFSGQGEHFMVHVRKRGENTKYVVNELAKACGVKSRDVSWAGLKDRHAVTEQWLSVHLPGQPDPDLSEFVATHPGVEILATARHDKKLRPGDLLANQFELVVTELSEFEQLEERLALIAQKGVPNYFGSQRFGRQGNNVTRARAWGNDEFRVRDKSKRSFYLSAARSWLFNMVLSQRIEQGLIEQVLDGDSLYYTDNAQYVVVNKDNQLDVDNGIAQISGPLTGDNALPTQADAAEFEQAVLDHEPLLLKVIRDNRMRHDRRALMLHPQAMNWQLEEQQLTLSFTLPAGCFATTVLRELIVLKDNEPTCES
ncbi:tRNA pseudouridine(13) synthase TruD [Thaumasiovibrio sp. DFM-14]|uniref:tRNA pseudouridine(13) synthase TruD n=1 Tax=Thaumasiovibrio sp. DFM-14 TaxID=3384792 RepID=UPI00399F5454